MLAHIAAHEQIAAMIKLELLHAPAVREFSTACKFLIRPIKTMRLDIHSPLE
jgi:hypothetical protein